MDALRARDAAGGRAARKPPHGGSHARPRRARDAAAAGDRLRRGRSGPRRGEHDPVRPVAAATSTTPATNSCSGGASGCRFCFPSPFSLYSPMLQMWLGFPGAGLPRQRMDRRRSWRSSSFSTAGCPSCRWPCRNCADARARHDDADLAGHQRRPCLQPGRAVPAGQEGFFWELVTLIDIMLLGHWIEMRSVRQASGALQELVKLMPDTAERILPDGAWRRWRSSALRAGDLVLVRPGGSAPADGSGGVGRVAGQPGDDHRRIAPGAASAGRRRHRRHHQRRRQPARARNGHR